jgi:hypothetical protein
MADITLEIMYDNYPLIPPSKMADITSEIMYDNYPLIPPSKMADITFSRNFIKWQKIIS